MVQKNATRTSLSPASLIRWTGKMALPLLLGLLFLVGAAVPASAFSVDVDRIYYSDPDRTIDYDFTAGTTGDLFSPNTILLPESAIVTRHTSDEGFLFMVPPDLGTATVTLNTGGGVGTIQTSTEGGAILTGGSSEFPPPPSDSWTWDVTLKNFGGITEDESDYQFYVGTTSPTDPPLRRPAWNLSNLSLPDPNPSYRVPGTARENLSFCP